MPRLKPPAAKRTPAVVQRCRYSHALIRRLIPDREGVVLLPGACIGMPPAVGCPVTCLDDMGGSSRAALAVRPGAGGSRTDCTDGSAAPGLVQAEATACRTER